MIGEVLLPEPDTIDFLEEIAGRVPGMHAIRFLVAVWLLPGAGLHRTRVRTTDAWRDVEHLPLGGRSSSP